MWRRRKWIGLAAFAAGIAGAFSLSLWLPDLYRATTIVVVESQQVPEELVRPAVTTELTTRIQRIRQELMSRSRLERLITELDLYPDLRATGVPIDEIVEQMRRDVDLDLTAVEQQGARGPTIAFAIAFSGRDPETVARAANTLAGRYIEEHDRMRAGQAAKTAAFLKAQLDDAKRQLEAQERRSSAFRLNHLGELPDQIAANLGSLERLNAQLRLNAESQLRALDRRDRLESELAAAESAERAAPPAPSPHAAQLTRLQGELAELRRQYSDIYPDVKRIQGEIAALERLEAARAAAPTAAPVQPPAKTRVRQSLGEIDAELKALADEETRLRGAIASYEQRVENGPKRQDALETMSRDYLSARERHDTLLERYEEAQLAENLERGQQTEQFRILDPALPPRDPAAPARMRLLAAGLIGSLVLALALMLTIERLDTSLHSVDDLQALVSGPLVFSIPVIPTRLDRRRHWQRATLATAVVVVGLALLVAGVRYVATGNERVVRLVARGQV
jgi:polysaccharide chain length determinant protein (PEP-CTERM system associated)